MIILNTVDKLLELVLAAPVTTTELDFVATYVDLTPTSFISAEQDGLSDGDTPVALVDPPAASTQRQVKYISVCNRDDSLADVTLQYNNNGDVRKLLTVALAPGSTLVYTDGEGFRVIDSTGRILSAVQARGSSRLIKQANPLATTLTDLYEVPTDALASLTNIWIANRSATPTTYRVAIAPLGAANDDQQYLAYDAAISGNGVINLSDLQLSLEAGDVVRVYATLATLSFTLYGSEQL